MTNRDLAYNTFISQALKYGFSLYGTPKTGQVDIWDPYDDGATRAGYPRSGPRFTDNGDGTITDNGSGLMWLRDPPLAGLNDYYEWAVALHLAHDLNYANHTDWRLPNAAELASLICFSTTSPFIAPVFSGAYYSLLWSSTVFPDEPDLFWGIDFTEPSFWVSSAFAFCAATAVRLGGLL